MGRGKDCTPEERRIIVNMWNNGKKLPEIAETLNRSRKMVYNVIISKKTNSFDATENKKQKPRIKKTNPEVDRYIVQISTNDPFRSSRDIANEINSQCGINVSARLIRRRLNDAQLFGHASLKKPPLLKKQNSIIQPEASLNLTKVSNNKCKTAVSIKLFTNKPMKVLQKADILSENGKSINSICLDTISVLSREQNKTSELKRHGKVKPRKESLKNKKVIDKALPPSSSSKSNKNLIESDPDIIKHYKPPASVKKEDILSQDEEFILPSA